MANSIVDARVGVIRH